ncbi:MAG: glycosyltransferase family 4 protein [Candidatus Omnitrophica bacterium]|nr:glycosyltransferase family 4 protein [Candidatus Omnitrophota bacterium]
MRIFACSIDFKPQIGGISEYCYQVSQSLVDNGHQVYFMAPKVNGSDEFDDKEKNLDIYRIEIKFKVILAFSYFNFIFKFKEFLKLVVGLRKLSKEMESIIQVHKIDYICCFFWDKFGWAAYMLKKKIGVPYYLMFHGKDIQENYTFSGFIQNILIRNADAIIVNSEFNKERIFRKVKKPPQIYVTYCGVNEREFFKKEVNEAFKKQLCIEGKKVILTLSRLVERKGVDRAIYAFKKYLDKTNDQNVVYLIGGVGPELVKLKKIANDLKLERKVFFLGEVEDKKKNEIYNLASLFILPCRELKDGDVEGFGIVFLEANCCEVPVIAGNTGGVPSAVINNVNGLLVDPDNIDEIAEKIEYLLLNEHIARKLGKNGRIRAINEFTWSQVAKRILFS